MYNSTHNFNQFKDLLKLMMDSGLKKFAFILIHFILKFVIVDCDLLFMHMAAGIFPQIYKLVVNNSLYCQTVLPGMATLKYFEVHIKKIRENIFRYDTICLKTVLILIKKVNWLILEDRPLLIKFHCLIPPCIRSFKESPVHFPLICDIWDQNSSNNHSLTCIHETTENSKLIPHPSHQSYSIQYTML